MSKRKNHSTKGTNKYIIKDRPFVPKDSKYMPHQGAKEKQRRLTF